jgi:hypothetical protein
MIPSRDYGLLCTADLIFLILGMFVPVSGGFCSLV